MAERVAGLPANRQPTEGAVTYSPSCHLALTLAPPSFSSHDFDMLYGACYIDNLLGIASFIITSFIMRLVTITLLILACKNKSLVAVAIRAALTSDPGGGGDMAAFYNRTTDL